MSKYIRKTEDEYEIQGWYPPYGWECATTETNRKDAKAQLACYRTDEPGISHRIIKRHVKITA